MRTLSMVTTAGALVLALALVVPALLGWQRYAIVSGSMSGSYDRGSLVLDDVVPVGRLRVGDAITYRPPAADHLITHRIAWIGRAPDGARLFRTRGDANPVADPWTFRLDRPTQARLRFCFPYAGFVVAALARRDVRLLGIALPALLLAAASLIRL
jgi:signal peptidase